MVKKILLLGLLGFIFLSIHSQNQAIDKIQYKTIPQHQGISLRTNVVSWIVLIPNVGLEYRPSNNLGLLVNGSYARWTWDDQNNYHSLWKVSPQVRLYLGDLKDSYVGIEGQVGYYNFRYSPEYGIQGEFIGGGLSCGHQFYVAKNLMVDIGFSLGYLYLHKTEEHARVDRKNVLLDRYNHCYWGPTALNMSFVWKIN